MRDIKELGNCEIIRDIERVRSDGHGGDERTSGLTPRQGGWSPSISNTALRVPKP